MTLLQTWLGDAAAGGAARWVDYVVVVAMVVAAWLFHRLSWPIARRLVRLSRYAHRVRDERPERRQTLQGIVADVISTAAFVLLGVLATKRLFQIDTNTIFWIVGLFSAAFGFGARPLIGDLLAGAGFIFGDTFAVGEKVGLKVSDQEFEGVVEAVNLRVTLIRAPTGELCVVPNGEIRGLRNYSRGRFSTANVKVRVRGAELARVLPLLEDLGREAAETLPELLEPWQVISESGEVGPVTELTLMAKTRFGTGADARPRLLALVQERLGDSGALPDG